MSPHMSIRSNFSSISGRLPCKSLVATIFILAITQLVIIVIPLIIRLGPILAFQLLLKFIQIFL